MSNIINLSKGEKIDLTKGTGITGIRVGLNWDEAGKSGSPGGIGGFFKSLVSEATASKEKIDIDSSIFMLDVNGKSRELVYFGHLRSTCGSIRHEGDNLTGTDRGKDIDDETIHVNLAQVPAYVEKLVIVANIYQCRSRRQHFGMIGNANVKLYDQAGKQICQYNLTEGYSGKTALIVGEVYRHGGEWKFTAVGQGTEDTGLEDMGRRY